MSEGPVLQVADLRVEYKGARRVCAVDGVSFELERATFLGVVGESGCGKSTMLFSIGQLLGTAGEIVSGSVRLGGRELVGLAKEELRRVRWRELAVVTQSAMSGFNPVLTLGAQFADAMRAHDPAYDTKGIEARGREVLEMVRVSPRHLRSYPHELSGGMRQRAMIAMALLLSPGLVLMDEPTSALDVVTQQSVMESIRELQGALGFAVVFVTHDLGLVREYSDRLAIMYAGQFVETGLTKAVFAEPKHPYSRALLSVYPGVHGPRVVFRGIPGSPPNLAKPPAGCRFADRCRFVMERCRSASPGVYVTESGNVRCVLYGPKEAAEGAPVGSGVPTGGVSAGDRAAVGGPGTGALDTASEATEAVLLTVGLTKVFRTGGFFRGRYVRAVEDVGLQIGGQEVVAVVGESGSGKTTVARLLAKLYQPTSGSISFLGRPLGSIKSRRAVLEYRGSVPVVYQDPYSSLSPSYPVNHGLMRTVKLHRRDLRGKERWGEIYRVLESVGLRPAEEFIDKYPHELSGGQRQRIGFAQSLLSKPKVIVADEPVSMLDVSIRIDLLNLMVDLRDVDKVSIVYITHDIASARYVADRVIVMFAGRIVEEGAVEAVLHEPRHPYTKQLLAAVGEETAAPVRWEGVGEGSGSESERRPGCAFRSRCVLAREVCGEVVPALAPVAQAHLVACHVEAGEAGRGEKPREGAERGVAVPRNVAP